MHDFYAILHFSLKFNLNKFNFNEFIIQYEAIHFLFKSVFIYIPLDFFLKELIFSKVIRNLNKYFKFHSHNFIIVIKSFFQVLK